MLLLMLFVLIFVPTKILAMKTAQHVCPVERANGLDNSLRKLLQNPEKIVDPYIEEGFTVIDIGCGPGFFTLPMANMVGSSGKVIASDLQSGMLNIVDEKIKNTVLEDRIVLHQCGENKLGIQERADFILAFYMVHEVPDQKAFLAELKSLLKQGGTALIVEPNFHVKKRAFNDMVYLAHELGFEILYRPRVFFSRAVLLS